MQEGHFIIEQQEGRNLLYSGISSAILRRVVSVEQQSVDQDSSRLYDNV